jgi:hypothetical protein
MLIIWWMLPMVDDRYEGLVPSPRGSGRLVVLVVAGLFVVVAAVCLLIECL